METNSYRMSFTIGGWQDLTNKTETCILVCNHTVEDVRKAYQDACWLTGVQFHNEGPNYIEEHWGVYNPEYYSRKVAVMKGRAELPFEAYTLLQRHGVDEFFATCDASDGNYINNFKTHLAAIRLTKQAYLRLWIWFVKLILSDLVVEVENQKDVPAINGGWDGLPVIFGGGFYD